MMHINTERNLKETSSNDSSQNRLARLIAYYLPQFHPIPENDLWWGIGFTEWTNVARAKPMFRGHYQPHIPADLGFYDLRVPEVRIAQAEMARKFGIEGFCYWHYWFAGKRLLERPFQEVLRSGEPDFPFCLGWANPSWTGIWYGSPDRILQEQTYPGTADHRAHFYSLVDAFADPRHLTIDSRPIFVVFNPHLIHEPKQYTECWKDLSVKAGLKEIYFIGIAWKPHWNPLDFGFDAAITNHFHFLIKHFKHSHKKTFLKRIFRKLAHKEIDQLYRDFRRVPRIIQYKDVVFHKLPPLTNNFPQYPDLTVNWDNTPRSGRNGIVFHNDSPELFRILLRKTIAQLKDRNLEHKLLFVKSWNEWAEGNHLEPDLRFGKGYLEVIREESTYRNIVP